MKAVIIGASVAGLLTARALSTIADSISVIDRDIPPGAPVPRKGVPQGRHVHGVLAGGLDVLKVFFPGLLEELLEEGSHLVDIGEDILWFNSGWRLRANCGVTGCIQTRPLLELHIRRRVEALSNIQFLYGHSALGFELDPSNTLLTAVRTSSEGAAETRLPADLVVDCSGRGSKTPGWLEACGLTRPSATSITVNVGYSTRYLRLAETPNWRAMIIMGQPPDATRLAAGFLVEGGEFQLTLGGRFRDYPPDDETGFIEFTKSLAHPGLFNAIRNATPVSPIVTYRFPSHVWNRYDRLENLPSNLFVLGDALCSFNPVYGQGMTVAAQEAQVLEQCLAAFSRSPGDMKKLRDTYFRKIMPILNATWALATGADLAYPQAEALRPFASGVINRYLGHIIGLTCSDKKVLVAWNQVTNLQRPLSRLFAPSIAGRVLRRALAGARPEENGTTPAVLAQ